MKTTRLDAVYRRRFSSLQHVAIAQQLICIVYKVQGSRCKNTGGPES